MKILKLLNKKNLSIIIISLLLSLPSIAEEKPVDIWNIEKQETDSISEENLSLKPLGVLGQRKDEESKHGHLAQ